MQPNDPISSFIHENEDGMFSLLRELVLIQSGSSNKKGVDAVVDCIIRTLKGSCLRLERIPMNLTGDHLLAATPCHGKYSKGILLVGHTDTVFPEDSPFNWYREDDRKAYGPGVIDMKGGLVCGIFALKALDAQGLLERIPVAFLFNSDEEIGSGSSRSLIEDLAKRSVCALVLECGGLEGGVVTGRKGRIELRLEVEGAAGHAAFAGKEKASAILELAHKVIALESLNRIDAGLTLNVGKVGGGIGPNTVPENAWGQIDIRYLNTFQKADILRRIDAVLAKNIVDGVKSRVIRLSERPPMPQSERNRELFTLACRVADRLGIKIEEEFRSGVSDANIIAQQQTPVIDGLGPIGALDHSDREYMLRDSLPSRSRLLAHLILEVWKRFYG